MIKAKEKNEFKPQPSTRIASRIAPDNDTWTEYLAVVDLLNPRTNAYQLEIRSFFESSATSIKAWDEPPSGAIHIEWASPEMKRMAQMQLRDLRVQNTNPSTNNDLDQNNEKDKKNTTSPDADGTNSKLKSATLWMKKLPFRRKPRMRLPEKNESTKISYEKGSETMAFMMEAKHKHENALQRALRESSAAISAHAHASHSACAHTHSLENAMDGTSSNLQEENDILLAKALSLSEAEANTHMNILSVAASAPLKNYVDNDCTNIDRKMPADPNYKHPTVDVNDEDEENNMDRKMPAQPYFPVKMSSNDHRCSI